MHRLLTLTLTLTVIPAIAEPPTIAPKTAPRSAANPIPDIFTNLQVLPKDISKHQLIYVMKGFSLTMKVRCSHCHAVSDDLTEGSFSSDDKETKIAARSLLRAILLATQLDLTPAAKS